MYELDLSSSSIARTYYMFCIVSEGLSSSCPKDSLIFETCVWTMGWFPPSSHIPACRRESRRGQLRHPVSGERSIPNRSWEAKQTMLSLSSVATCALEGRWGQYLTNQKWSRQTHHFRWFSSVLTCAVLKSFQCQCSPLYEKSCNTLLQIMHQGAVLPSLWESREVRAPRTSSEAGFFLKRVRGTRLLVTWLNGSKRWWWQTRWGLSEQLSEKVWAWPGPCGYEEKIELEVLMNGEALGERVPYSADQDRERERWLCCRDHHTEISTCEQFELRWQIK